MQRSDASVRSHRRALQHPDRLHALSLLAVMVFLALTSINAGESPGWTAFDNLGEALAGVLATVACAIRLRRERTVHASVLELRRQGFADAAAMGLKRQARIAWWLLTAGVGAWAIGQVGWTIYESGFGIEPPTPSPLDVPFLLSSALIIGGLLAMVRTPAGHLTHLRGVLEGLFIACGFFLCSWTLVIGSVLEHSNTPTLSGAINLAYPVLDAMALAAVFFVALRRRQDAPSGLVLLALGIACIALSDSAYWYLTDTRSTFPGVSPLDAGWVAGLLLVGLAALRSPRARRTRRGTDESRLSLVLPALPATVGLATVLGGWLFNGSVESEGPLLGITAVTLVAGLGLLVTVMLENRVLTTDLERRVEERTAELHATERYYRALVQRSSDVVMVVDPDLSIRYVSHSISTIFGYPPEQLTGRRLDALGAPAAHALAQATERAGLNPAHETRVEWELTDAHGRMRRAESTVTDLLGDPHVGGFVINTRDDSDRAALADQLRSQAFRDPLTGLANRALLSDRAGQALARSQRTGSAVAVMAIELDAFKLVNEAFGHEAGDRVLCAVAERLRGVLRPEDTVARIGGDEFVILVDGVSDSHTALAFGQRVRTALAPAHNIEGTEHTVTASIGVAVGATHTSFEQLLCDAEVALYTVKRDAKGSVELFQASMHQQARQRFELQAELRKAIDSEAFWLLYQPEFDVAGGQLRGFEAVLRWNHPDHGLIAQERFIAMAEETGLVVPLGRWVLDHALQQLAAWNAIETETPLSVAVGLSPAQLAAPSLGADVERALRRSGVHPTNVVLEISEGALLDCSPRIVEVLHALKELGVRLAVDGFGTGHAAVSYLERMPVDILKIDRSFVAASDVGGRRSDLFEAIVNIGRALSLVTIAAGVEHRGQLEAARRAGCDLAQGYLLGRPLPPEAAHSLILERLQARSDQVLKAAAA
jgi:diguanylate cyclase (GGDEF)-like protein/PAS domain S-box-containing protein